MTSPSVGPAPHPAPGLQPPGDNRRGNSNLVSCEIHNSDRHMLRLQASKNKTPYPFFIVYAYYHLQASPILHILLLLLFFYMTKPNRVQHHTTQHSIPSAPASALLALNKATMEYLLLLLLRKVLSAPPRDRQTKCFPFAPPTSAHSHATSGCQHRITLAMSSQ